MLEPGSWDRAGRPRLRGSLYRDWELRPRPEKEQVGMQMASCFTAPPSARNPSPLVWMKGLLSLAPPSFTGSPGVPTPALSASATP